MDEKDNKRKQKVLKALQEGKIKDDTTFSVFQMIEDINERLDEEIPKITDVIERLKGDKGDSPTEEELIGLIKPLIPDPIVPKDGEDYVLTEADKKEIAATIQVPVVEKEVKTIIEKTEVIRETPIVTENVVEKAIYEEPNQIVEKVNKAETKIKKGQVEGLDDIERIAKLNAEKGFNPTMGPSFNDLTKKVEGASENQTTPKLTVSFTEPKNPKLYDLWYDLN